MAAVADTTCTVSNLVSTGSQVDFRDFDSVVSCGSGVGFCGETVNKKGFQSNPCTKHTSHFEVAHSVDQQSPCDSQCQPHHASHVQRRDDLRDGPSGRDAPKGVDHDGDFIEIGRASHGAWPGTFERREEQDPLAQACDPVERGFQTQSQLGGVRPKAASGSDEWQRDHPEPPASLPPQDLRGDPSMRRGPSGFRQTFIPELPRADDHSEGVQPMGDQHDSGEHGGPDMRPSPSAFGTMADVTAGKVQADTTAAKNGACARSSPHREGLPQGQDREGQDRSFRDILRLRQCHQFTAASHPSADPEFGQCGGGSEGGSECDQTRTSSERGQEGGREFQRQLLSGLSLDSVSSGSQDLGSDPSCSDHSVAAALDIKHEHEDQAGKVMSIQEQRLVEQTSNQMLPSALQSLVTRSRVKLLEVACSPDSVLASSMQTMTGEEGSAVRCSLWNGCDLRKGSGVRMVLDQIDLHQPEHVWMSPECGPYSVMQNINQRTEAQRLSLEEKRKDALRQYVSCAIIYRYCVQRGIHVSWEWSQSCQGWRLPLIQKLVHDVDPKFAVVRGCQVNLRDSQKQFVNKGWKVMTTHPLVAQRLDMPCRCSPGTKHVPCEGSLTAQTAFYTPEFAKRVCSCIIQGSDHALVQQELQFGKPENPNFGLGTMCVCSEGHAHGADITCGHCTQGFVAKLGTVHDVVMKHEAHAGHEVGHAVVTKCHETCEGHEVKEHVMAVQGCKRDFPQGLSPKEIQKRLYLLHAATGHGPVKHLILALKRRGAPAHVVKEAEQFKCSVCHERSQPKPRNQSSLEPQPRRLEVLSADVGHWVHPMSGEHQQFLLMVDEGSRFRVARHLHTGQQKHISATQFISTLKEAWFEYFGIPHTLRVDPDGAFRSHELSAFCDQNHIFLDMIPGEAHWKNGTCEKGVQGLKELMYKLASDFPDEAFVDLLSEATRVFNSRELVRGFSPIQHVMGRAPDETGRFFPVPTGWSDDLLCEGATAEHTRCHQLRLEAEKAYLDWSTRQRMTRARNSRGQRVLDFSAGDLVFIWRKQQPHKTQQGKPGQGKFIGPARILATERARDQQGHLKQGSSIWLVRGRRLLKCCAEQLRHASPREQLLEELHSEDPQPWSFTKVSNELGGNEYDDLTEVEVPLQEWHRAADPLLEMQPSKRFRGKSRVLVPRATAAPAGDDLSVEQDLLEDFSHEPGGSSSSRAVRSRSPVRQTASFLEAKHELPKGEHWSTKVHESYFVSETRDFWQGEQAAVQLEIELPDTRAKTERVLKDMHAFITTSLKRRAVEVSERRLTPTELQEFAKAKSVEVNNFIAAKAFEALPADYRVDRTQAVKMRWILTWKRKDDGSKKAKARAVLLGYQDPLYEHRSTMSPTTTRQTRQLQLQIAASSGFITEKGDVTGAFLQSRPYPSELHCIPCKEICQAMGLPEESVVRVQKACYGLVDAPLEWYRSVSMFFEKLGFHRCLSDPCCWVLVKDHKLRGIVSGHVDDFLFSGSTTDPVWMAARKAIMEEFKWSDWENKKFTQCGVCVEEHPDGSYSLSQAQYVEELKYINLRANRRKEKESSTDDWEKSQLRTLLGGLSWHAQQVAPHLSADVSLLLSQINTSTTETIKQANGLLDQARAMKEHRMKIHNIPVDQLMLCAWCDAASQNRHDGYSTQGIIIGAVPKDLLRGQCVPVSFMSWHSSKITRVCRSPGASEAAAAVNAEDLLFFARFQLAEMLGFPVQVRSINKAVNTIQGCVVTDSRNVFDKLSTEVLCPKGAERRTDLELLSLKDSQLRNHVCIRWVHSEAQLANSLTKTKELRQLMLFYQMQQTWRIVEDSSMASAKKRKQRGQPPLENGPGHQNTETSTTHINTHITSAQALNP